MLQRTVVHVPEYRTFSCSLWWTWWPIWWRTHNETIPKEGITPYSPMWCYNLTTLVLHIPSLSLAFYSLRTVNVPLASLTVASCNHHKIYYVIVLCFIREANHCDIYRHFYSSIDDIDLWIHLKTIGPACSPKTILKSI